MRDGHQDFRRPLSTAMAGAVALATASHGRTYRAGRPQSLLRAIGHGAQLVRKDAMRSCRSSMRRSRAPSTSNPSYAGGSGRRTFREHWKSWHTRVPTVFPFRPAFPDRLAA